eukprot:gene24927-10578_t
MSAIMMRRSIAIRQPGRVSSVRVSATQMRPTSTMTKPSTPATNNYGVSLFDAMKFNGPAPELINGRLAMLGFVMAAYKENETGELMASQLEHLSIGVCLQLAFLVWASLVPITKGVKNEAFGPFSPRAEIVNGRAAMLAFVALAVLENKAGVPFF